MTLRFALICCTFLLFFACQTKTQATNPKLGEQIRQARLQQGLEQWDFAQRIGISTRSLSLIEDGRATPTQTKLHEMEKVLQTEFVLD